MRHSRWIYVAGTLVCATTFSFSLIKHSDAVDANGVSPQPPAALNAIQKTTLSGESPIAKDKVEIGGVEVPYPTWFTTALPGAETALTLAPDLSVSFEGKPVSAEGWQRRVKAPEQPGVYELRVSDPDGRELYQISYFVLEPARNIKRGRLNGYRIGNYPVNAPQGYIRLDGRDDQEARISPHFRIGQFLCKQQPGHWPKYLVVTPSLLKRLEVLLAELHREKLTDADTLFVMSGYRTPFYNTAIGSAKRSRHMWGDAADIYVDVAPQDGQMDDLNRDGRVNKGDANWLYDYAEHLYAQRADVKKGGIGSYRANAVHGPFVHIDGRGQKARWGR